LVYIQMMEELFLLGRDDNDLGRNSIMEEEVRKILSELNNDPLEKGFPNLVEDVDIDMQYYESYIAGIITSWLQGSSINIGQIDRGEDLDKRLDQIIEVIQKYKNRKRKIDQMVNLLLEGN